METLPEELRALILGFVRDEYVLICVFLRRHACECRRRLDLDGAIAAWEAVRSLPIRDRRTLEDCLRTHDVWYQTLEDPYDMSPQRQALMSRFEAELAPILAAVVLQARKDRERRRILEHEMVVSGAAAKSGFVPCTLHSRPPEEKNTNPLDAM